MKEKWNDLMGGAGFYITMAVCLLVIGIGGYFLLFYSGEPEPTAMEAELPHPVAATPVPEITDIPAENAAPSAEEPETPQPVSVPAPIPEFEPDDTPVVAQAPRTVVAPLDGQVVSAFSVDALVYNETLEDWRIHDGMDISAPEGSEVLAACAGTVLSVDHDTLMGTTVTLRHADGYHTTYASLQEDLQVEIGDQVSAGQVIGSVGCTAAAEAAQGSHLHFSFTKDGDVVNPETFLNR